MTPVLAVNTDQKVTFVSTAREHGYHLLTNTLARGHTMRKQENCMEKEIMQGTMPGVHRRGRPRTAWIDNINTWTGLSVEESIRMTEDGDKWRRKHIHGVANPSIEDG